MSNAHMKKKADGEAQKNLLKEAFEIMKLSYLVNKSIEECYYSNNKFIGGRLITIKEKVEVLA